MRRRGRITTNAPRDDEITRAVMEAAEAVYGIPFRYRWRPLVWFRRWLR